MLSYKDAKHPLGLERPNKQSVEEVAIKTAVTTTIYILLVQGLFDKNNKAIEVLKEYCFVESRRPNLKEVNNVIQGFFSYIQIEKKATSITSIHE